MKNYLKGMTAYMGLFMTMSSFSQETIVEQIDKTPVVKYTVMERFEPDLVLTASERKELKAERFAEMKSKLQILDTMDISDRRREKLTEDVIENPFSPRLSKAFTDIEFEN